jgi:hypothetical protein
VRVTRQGSLYRSSVLPVFSCQVSSHRCPLASETVNRHSGRGPVCESVCTRPVDKNFRREQTEKLLATVKQEAVVIKPSAVDPIPKREDIGASSRDKVKEVVSRPSKRKAVVKESRRSQ